VRAARRRRWAVPATLLAVAAGLPAAGALPAAAAPAGAVPAGALPDTAAGIVTIFHSPGIHLLTRSYTNDGITAGPDRAVWFTNPGNNTIGRITPASKVKDYAGKGIDNPWEITTGPDGALWYTNFYGPTVGRITTGGKVTTFHGAMNGPDSIARSRSGTLWYVNWPLVPVSRCSWSIGRITTSGVSTCFKAPGVEYPQRITVGPDGAMWFTIGGVDGTGYAIGRITKSGAITVYPLQDWPQFIAAGSDHALWFTYTNNNAIGRITTKGVLTSYTSPSISSPADIAAGPDGALWFINMGNNTIGRIATTGQVTSYRGPFGLTAGGPEITAGPDGAMWFTNPTTNTIGRITTDVTPWIFSKTPASGPPGTTVTILGRNLQQAAQVAFNGAPATIISDTATYLVTIVPPGATSGRIAITTPAGTATRNGWFTVTAPRTR
jgi:virginiamycin B lyase